jgi:hypothetical protein
MSDREYTPEELKALADRATKLAELAQRKESHRRSIYGDRYRRNVPYRRWDR